jgi:hypothetical protein
MIKPQRNLLLAGATNRSFHLLEKAMSESGETGADAGAAMLPEWFKPTEKDVICGWARQNHRHGE